MGRRVVVTGMGAITPIGNNVDEFWDGIKVGKVGIGPITKFDTDGFKVKLAAEVKDFDAKEYMTFKEQKRMAKFSQFAIAAATQAIEESKLNMEEEDPYRVGCIVGSGIGSLQIIEDEHTRMIERDSKRVKPLFIPMMISNMATGNISIKFGIKGKCINIVTACATGSHCIGEAYRTVKYDDADVMIAGGTESTITKMAVAGFTSMTALATTEDVNKASIPFDKDRTGFVMGEGAGVVILEELEHAKKRGAKILGEVVGYGATSDAFHITSPAEDGAGAAKAMELAIREAKIEPKKIEYLNAHGTSTVLNEVFESIAIKTVFGDAYRDVVVNSTKSMTGHTLGAAGAIEFIVCIKSILDSYVHTTANTKNIDEKCDVNVQINGGKSMDVNYALSNSLGFGGHNAALLVKKYEA